MENKTLPEAKAGVSERQRQENKCMNKIISDGILSKKWYPNSVIYQGDWSDEDEEQRGFGEGVQWFPWGD